MQTDIFPTITALCGLPNPAGIQGRSLTPLLENPSTSTGYDSALIEFGISGAHTPSYRPTPSDSGSTDLWTLRTREWRLSHYPGASYGELYDLTADPEEFSNLWSQSKYREVRTRLQVQLLDRMLLAHDPLPVREQPY